MTFATAISPTGWRTLLLAVAIVIAGQFTGFSQENDPAKAVRRTYWQALAAYNAHTNQVQTAWEFGRACFDVGEVATNSTERAAFAEEGIAACQQAVANDPQSAAAHYYLAMDLGQLARTRGIGALKLVKQMEKEFLKAAELDSHFDHAGPDRNLGMLYRDAPSIASVGNRSKATHHLEKAVELAPDYPENRIALIEASLAWHDRYAVAREMKALEAMLPAARQQFSGPAWTSSWQDWDSRLKTIRKRLTPVNVLEAPRHAD